MENKKGLIFIGLGFELVGLIMATLYVGRLIDETYGWSGLGVASMVLLGTAGWFYHLIILLKRFMEEDKSEGDNT